MTTQIYIKQGNVNIEWDDIEYKDMIPVKMFEKEKETEKKTHDVVDTTGLEKTWKCRFILTVRDTFAKLDYRKSGNDVYNGVLYIYFVDKNRRDIDKKCGKCRGFDWLTKKEADQEEETVVEGVRYRREVERISRSSGLADECKKLDKFRCRACGYVLIVNGKHVLEAHHWRELSKSGKVLNSPDDLVTLCPNCHCIAHAMNRTNEAKSLEDEVVKIQKHARKATKKLLKNPRYSTRR